ncbi:MAG: LuxR C-terminal-related transcriptional regulator [Desulfitobacterium hafniense]|nr:LuxR C-terminal-related transcriptional regulator [Desulfitobacterium hafniense]
MLKAKLQAPIVNQRIISREQLQRKFRRVQECHLTLVTAPAGSGKTTAVLEWLGKCDLPWAWLSLDGGDNQPVTFWRYVCAALDKIVGGIAKDTEYVWASSEMVKAHIHLNILIDRLAEAPTDFLLVLDDLHEITEPSILKGLSYLMDYLPAKMHLILISRREPELDLARQRIKWQAQRLGEEDLRFQEEEISRFYQARGYTLPEDELKKVKSYTEGWAAAMVAVAMSMENAGGGNALAALPQSSRDIEEYLHDEVVSTWMPERLDFALRTCILDTLSPALCEAVTGEVSSAGLLKEISQGSGFLNALAEQEQSYQYHHLFKSFLHKLLRETAPHEIPRLHRRAGCWFQAQGRMPEAIEHFLNGGFYGEAFELMEHQSDDIIDKNDFGRLLSWIERLPEGYRRNSFKIAVIYVLYYAENGRFDLSRQWLNRMKDIQAERQAVSSPEWSAYSRTLSTMAEANLLVREGSSEFLPLILAAAETDGGRYYKMPEYHDFNVGDIYFYRSPINRIVGLFREAPGQYARMIESYRAMISKNPGYAPLASGEYLYESNRLEEALPFLLKAMEEGQEANCPGALVPAMVDIARVKRAEGDISGAFSVLEKCAKLLPDNRKSHWIYLLQAYRCRLLMDIGDTEKVREWVLASKLDLFTELSRFKEYELIIYARAMIYLNRTQDARLLLQRLLTFTGDSGRSHSRVEVLNLLALLDFRNHHTLSSFRYMDESFAIGLKEGYVRSYLDELSPMAQILRAYLKSRRKPAEEQLLAERRAWASSLLKQMPGSLLPTLEACDQVAAGKAGKIWEQLTVQERRVLELMANAATNQQISDTLGISLRTVKTHTGNIYGKLGLKNRSQCLKLVRELGLL